MAMTPFMWEQLTQLKFSGNDTFIFGQTTSGTIGKVTINNFSATHDVIQIASALGVGIELATLSPHITNVSGSAVIALDASGDTIRWWACKRLPYTLVTFILRDPSSGSVVPPR